VIRTIIDRTSPGTDYFDSIGLLDFLYNIDSVSQFPAKTGEIRDDQVVDVAVVLFDKRVEFLKIRSVEIGTS